MALWILIVGFAIGFALAFSIGANDVANSFGTSVGSKVLTLTGACILATIFETAGSVLVGAKVSSTISKGIIDITQYSDSVDLLRFGYLSALLGACIWLMIATLFKLPVSGTHSIVGAVIGFAIVAKGWMGVRWFVLGKIVGSWFISPVFSGAISAGIYMFVHVTIIRGNDSRKQLNRGVLLLPLFYAAAFAINSFSIVFEGPEILYFHVIPWWGAIIISFGIGLIAAAVVRFLVAPRLKRHIIKTRSHAVAMAALEDVEDYGKDDDDEDDDDDGHDAKKLANNEAIANVGKTFLRREKEAPKTLTVIPDSKYYSDNAVTSVGSTTTNSADISGASTPMILTPRTPKFTPNGTSHEKPVKHEASPVSTATQSGPEIAPKSHQKAMKSVDSSVANSNETLVTVVSVLEKKSAKFYEPDDEGELNDHEETEEATIVPGSSLQAALRYRETPCTTPSQEQMHTGKDVVAFVDHAECSKTYGEIMEDENQLTITSFIGRDTSRRKRTQSGRSNGGPRSVASTRFDHHDVNEWPDVFRLFAFLQILTACFGAFAHGGNDVSNAVGPVIGLYQLHGSLTIPVKTQAEWWILFLGGVGISVGLWTLGRRVIETVGSDLTQVTPLSGFSIEIGAATTVLLASQIGIPVSTTHCKVGSVVFVGLCRGRNQVDWHIFRNIVLAWFITVPASAAFSAAVMAVLTQFFYSDEAAAVADLALNNATTAMENVTTIATTSLL